MGSKALFALRAGNVGAVQSQNPVAPIAVPGSVKDTAPAKVGTIG
jgi:hypothetical protein